MDEGVSGLNNAANGRQINQSKTQGKFDEHPIACITVGILLSLTGIGLLIGTPLIAIGARRLLSREAKVLEKDANQANKVGNSQSNQSKETNQNINSSDTSPQPTSLTTNEVPTVTVLPGEGYENVVNGVVNFVKDNSENIATCMANDGTHSRMLNADGTFFENTDNDASIKSINTAKELTDDELKGLINGNVENQAKFKGTQTWKDFQRNCRTFNIYGTTLTFNEQDESYEDFMKRAADEIKRHETQKLNKPENDLTNTEKKQIEEKQIKFFRQILKYPGQSLYGSPTVTYSQYILLNQDAVKQPSPLSLVKAHNPFITSLTEDGTITIESTYNAVIIPGNGLSQDDQNHDIPQGTTIILPNRLCVKEEITATIPLSEGEKSNDSKFIVNKNTTTFFIANAHGESQSTHITIDTSTTKPVIAMEYINTGIDGQPPTFAIK